MKLTKNVLFVLLVVNASAHAADYQECLLQMISSAADDTAISTIKDHCKAQKLDAKLPEVELLTSSSAIHDKPGLIETRLKEESLFSNSKRILTAHKPNYIVYSYNTQNPSTEVFEQQYPGQGIEFDHSEIKFQISTKFLLAEDVLGDNGDVYLAYTNRSFWQAGNDNISSPFRDYNHEPEVWLSLKNDYEFWGFKNSLINLGFVHQSNGRAGLLSRSWNRVYANFLVEKDNFAFSFKPWYRIPEDENDDDNPDIEKYLGNFELQSFYKHQDHTFSLMLRNNLRSDNYGAAQLDWTFPLHPNFKGYVQWFNGYGESLIDYNHSVNALSVGIKLTDWL